MSEHVVVSAGVHRHVGIVDLVTTKSLYIVAGIIALATVIPLGSVALVMTIPAGLHTFVDTVLIALASSVSVEIQ